MLDLFTDVCRNAQVLLTGKGLSMEHPALTTWSGSQTALGPRYWLLPQLQLLKRLQPFLHSQLAPQVRLVK